MLSVAEHLVLQIWLWNHVNALHTCKWKLSGNKTRPFCQAWESRHAARAKYRFDSLRSCLPELQVPGFPNLHNIPEGVSNKLLKLNISKAKLLSPAKPALPQSSHLRWHSSILAVAEAKSLGDNLDFSPPLTQSSSSAILASATLNADPESTYFFPPLPLPSGPGPH